MVFLILIRLLKTITYCSYTSRTEIIHTFVDYADFINTAMPMYNLIDYNDNYSDSSGSLWGSKRDEIANNANMTNDDNAPLFKYKQTLLLILKQMKQKRE